MQIGHIFAVAAAAGLTAPATAQDGKVAPSLIDALADCLAIQDNAGRLACTDIAAGKLVDAAKRKEVVIVDREEMKSTRRSLFGFQLPRIGLFGRNGPDKGDEIDKIEAKIVSVSTLGYGKYSLLIEGGGRWATTEAWTSAPFPAAGATASIRKASLGSYFVKIGNSKAVRAMRTG